MHWRARIATDGGRPVGAGVLVDDRRIVTCAHVVHGLSKVVVALPGVVGDLTATVRDCGTGWERLDDLGDIAVLELDTPLDCERACVFAPLDALVPQNGALTYELRALGYPLGHEQDGTHVTLRTSGDRLLRAEWLEVEVAQAHLRRLDEGFSGAAVYDPTSERVVGIVTDAVLGGEQGGYTGRMLPLASMRRHWEELDDLLDLDWLATEPRRELRMRCAGAEPRIGLEVIVRKAFPAFRRTLPAFASVWDAIRYVGEQMPGGEDRLERLLRVLVPQLPTPAREDVEQWMRCWLVGYAERGRAEVGAAARSTGSVIVRLEPLTRGASLELTVSTVVDGVRVGGAGPERVRRAQVPAKVEALLAEQVAKVHDLDWMLEFVVPEGLMNQPFEDWSIHEPGAARPRPLRSVPVVVRHVERLKPVTAARLTRKRWETVRARRETRPQPVRCGSPYDYAEFYDWLDADDDLCALAYAATPRPDWLSAALDTGVPIMLWRRRDCGADGGEGHVRCAAEAYLDVLVAAVGAVAPDLLPTEVMKLRKEARSPHKGSADHCGHRLTLFWDDPERKPDPPLAMGSS
ncbi:trypsin-like peptidase domain-containing protein [Actinomycetota bacterium Odt1-20B]